MIDGYLQAKYGSGGPDSGRFEPDADEVHASQVSDCQRKRYWKHNRGHRSDPSPYFELGRMFELMYGGALVWEHDPDVGRGDLNKMQPWELAEASDVVHQDVGVEIDLGNGSRIVGESDWVVTEPGSAEVETVKVDADGDRTMVTRDGSEEEYTNCVQKVVETKTKKAVEWVEKKGPNKEHIYQVYPYMHGMDCPGEIAYMERNDWSELVVELDYDEDKWLDCVIRARRHSENVKGDEVPPATPLDDGECRFCPFRDECIQMGGSEYT